MQIYRQGRKWLFSQFFRVANLHLVTLEQASFDPVALYENTLETLSRDHPGTCGALVNFVGFMRSAGKAGEALTAMRLDAYPKMTLRGMTEITKLACDRFALAYARVHHRYGLIRPDEAIVFVATAAGHRRQAFEGADFLMDYLKSQAPFWKCEIAGTHQTWIEPTEQDQSDLLRWS